MTAQDLPEGVWVNASKGRKRIAVLRTGQIVMQIQFGYPVEWEVRSPYGLILRGDVARSDEQASVELAKVAAAAAVAHGRPVRCVCRATPCLILSRCGGDPAWWLFCGLCGAGSARTWPTPAEAIAAWATEGSAT